ncbi:MAG: N-acetyltransferase [Planctomycetes bacterium]|nr:N-acetyltransferase [Planctomycetota bacterium]
MSQPTSDSETNPVADRTRGRSADPGLELRTVQNRADLKLFIDLPYRLHSAEPFFVPPLRFDQKRRLDRKSNPFFRHSEAEYFLALRSGRVVGRIAAIDYKPHREIHGENVGFFGWFECIDDQAVADRLFETAAAWLAARGIGAMRGPASFCMNDEVGVLVEGYEVLPSLLTPWNPPYYEALMTGWGLAKVMDLVSFALPVASYDHERLGRIVDRITRRANMRLRRFDLANFDREVEHFKRLYNDAWNDNWGFVGLTDAEIDHMAKDLKPLIEPKLAHFVEVDGEPVGFALVLPDLNQILKGLRGRLFPFGIFKLLFGLKRVSRIRLLAMGVRRDFHRSGLDSVLYHASYLGARELGKVESELGWVLESNTVMITTIEKVGGRRHRTHRLLEKALSA